MPKVFYPRVLVVNGDPFCKSSATGLTMINLFRGWPEDRLAQVFTSAFSADFGVCTNFWRLPPLAMVSHKQGYRVALQPATVTTQIGPQGANCLGNPVSAKPLAPWLGGWMRDVGREAMELLPYQLSEVFWRWIKEFDPDVVYSYFGSIRIMRLAYQVADRLEVPIVPHFMDDWPSTIYRRFPLSLLLQRNLVLWLDRCLAFSPIRMAIGEDMAGEFAKRYGSPFLPLMNCVDDVLIDRPFVEPPERFIVRFIYVGTLYFNRWKSLCEIGRALARLRSENIMGELIVFGSVNPGIAFERLALLYPVVHLAGVVSSDDVPSVQNDADCLIHVESFEPNDRLYTRLSISSKIPSYLASGRPVLAYGPSELASVRFIEETGCGQVVVTQDEDILAEALAKIIKSPSLRLELGRRAKVLAGVTHRASDARNKLRSVLERAAANPDH